MTSDQGQIVSLADLFPTDAPLDQFLPPRRLPGLQAQGLFHQSPRLALVAERCPGLSLKMETVGRREATVRGQPPEAFSEEPVARAPVLRGCIKLLGEQDCA